MFIVVVIVGAEGIATMLFEFRLWSYGI